MLAEFIDPRPVSSTLISGSSLYSVVLSETFKVAHFTHSYVWQATIRSVLPPKGKMKNNDFCISADSIRSNQRLQKNHEAPFSVHHNTTVALSLCFCCCTAFENANTAVRCLTWHHHLWWWHNSHHLLHLQLQKILTVVINSNTWLVDRTVGVLL